MSVQQINTDLLEKKKQQLENHKNNIMDSLGQIKDEYMKLINNKVWTGPRSDAFIESLRTYWQESDSGQGNGVIERIHLDFANMVTFISSAIDKTLDKDAKVAQDIGNEAGVSGTSSNLGTSPTTTKPSPTTPNTTVPQTSAPATTQPQTTVPQTSAPTTTQPETTESQKNSSGKTYISTVSQPTSGTPTNVSVGAFYPDENNNENNNVSALDYRILNTDGTPTRDYIHQETMKIDGKEYEVYTYDDPETPEQEHYIIGAIAEEGQRSTPTARVYTIDYGNGEVYEFVDFDTNYTEERGNEITPPASKYDTYVDILSVRGHAYTNVGEESRKPVKIIDTGKTVSRK